MTEKATDPSGARGAHAAQTRRLGYVSAAICGALLALGACFVLRDLLDGVHREWTWPTFAAGAVSLLVLALARSVLDVRAASPTTLITPTASEPRRRWVIVTASFVAIVLQAIIPLRYYLGDDAYDERFSWRMFSAVRMHDCELSVNEVRPNGERPPPLTAQVHFAWKELMERNREDVTEHYLRYRCDEGAERVTVVNECVRLSGDREPVSRRAIDCASGEIDRHSLKTSTSKEAR